MNSEISLQSHRIFGEKSFTWTLLDKQDYDLLSFPEHLEDQIFRIHFCVTPAAHLFEIQVSEQCPKDSYTHLGKSLSHLGSRAFVVNLIHQRSPNAHLIMWHAEEKKQFFHQEIDFSHCSEFDQCILQKLYRISPCKKDDLFLLLRGKKQSDCFFKTLKKHLDLIPCTQEKQYHAMVDFLLKLVFLIFVQRKGWLNFDPYYLETKMSQCSSRGLSVIHCFFKPLFARLEGLPAKEIINLGTLPRLGGGLFSFAQETLPMVPNRWCDDLYRQLMSNYSFSLFEAQNDRDVVGIGPEMLGHVFENLLHHKERKRFGVFYTPPEVARKQAHAALKAWCLRNCPLGRPISDSLKNIRVLDPSCGSGTYLMAAYSELLRLRLQEKPWQERYNGKLFALKQEIIQDNLYGMDIHPMAVRLTEVRLWLNMIQDLEISDPTKAPALPSLQHHLRPGDFLCQFLPENEKNLAKWPKLALLERLRGRFPFSSPENRVAILKHMHRLERELNNFLLEKESAKKRAFIKEQMAQLTLPGHDRELPEQDWKEPLGYQFHAMFSREMLSGGFDLILGNPPWLSATQIATPVKRNIMKRLQIPPGLELKGQIDLSLYFVINSLALLKEKGHLGFLLPGKILQARYADGLRAYLKQHTCIDYLYDYGIDHRMLFKADTFPLALGLSLQPSKPGDIIEVEQHAKDGTTHFHFEQNKLAKEGWNLCAHLEERPSFSHWPRLKDFPHSVHRGIVTNAKKIFVFETKPSFLEENALAPLVRGRDIQSGSCEPGRLIYWPYQRGASWTTSMSEGEIKWQQEHLSSKRKVWPGYNYRKLKAWKLVWKYLGSKLETVLFDHDWIPDQTTYYLDFDDLETAWRFFSWFQDERVNQYLRGIAERGKDRCFFYYAHTIKSLPIPPDLMERPLSLPEKKNLYTAADYQLYLETLNPSLELVS